MPANYLHGVETLEIESGPRPVKAVKSAVIALIGTAPCGPVNQPTLCLSENDAAQFGPVTENFTIPQALKAIYDHGAGTVVVINTLIPATHKTTVTNEEITFERNGRAKLKHASLQSLSVNPLTGSGGHYTLDVDYTVDMMAGEITWIGTPLNPADRVCADYEYTDPKKVTPDYVIGSTHSNIAGDRSGIQLLQDIYNQYGFTPKILIAPVFCTQQSVSSELIGQAEKLGAIAYIDAPIGTTFQQVLAGRGSQGTINFNTSSDRARLFYPHVKVYDSATNTEVLEPLSSRAAGLRAKIDLEKGFWWSNSNQEIQGITGIERSLTAMIDAPQSEVNQLNENGITTVFNSYGSGLRLWGNRTAAWPTVTHMRNFENVRRTGDVINESIRYFSQQYMDMPINQALIDALTESVNSWGRKLIADGALLGFECWYDPARNEQTELAAGHLLLSYKFTPPPPLERLTYETEITSEYLVSLESNN
ncbi:phage tail sheath subtilisin-like domain-containing protein [Enterobacter cancerogenus]|uniref:phage tail sheath subtilisin-like domain-containing protein n=1 Tax=Enterobacter cancerogenus TaxID=69218 RepID=UPI000733F24B|nr:phage tail sheath family protein [Enterobacter cancerogenus]KTQ46747.1 tail protein [Enterobacter cancerogenus]KTQ54123.1 tail protein [Enterobacter cancerogenus]KTQ68141.1 tail protein [Enterobacter cancerogenus]KTQ81493.1 tail protein [Enterobacter cancerogenus]MDT7009897.1 phage tail sheath family protein [Enterobacter cancerogenus]